MVDRVQASARAAKETIRRALNRAETRLAEGGTPTPRLDAEVLLAHVLGADRCRLVREAVRWLSPAEACAFDGLVERRLRREPVAYLIGYKEFWSLSFRIDARALIPRPESETVLEEVQELFAAAPPARFADVGCGSGCLACALALMFARSRGTATDRDEDALGVARSNLSRHRLADRVALRLGNLLDPLDGEPLDLVCANLPYVPTLALGMLSADIYLYEPLAALDGGPDGLGPIRKLVAQAPSRLRPGGWLVLEVGDDQAGTVVRLCRQAGFGQVHSRRDLAGVERVVAARWPC